MCYNKINLQIFIHLGDDQTIIALQVTCIYIYLTCDKRHSQTTETRQVHGPMQGKESEMGQPNQQQLTQVYDLASLKTVANFPQMAYDEL